jgi:hypothetical protein
MLRLSVKSIEAGAEFIELKPGAWRLGRSQDNDFPVPHPTVSATHCEIVCQEDSVKVRDCGSTNGTFIGGKPIQESELKPGQTLHLGDVEMLLEKVPDKVVIPDVDFAAPPPPPPLPDGSAACLNHAEVRARRKCNQCQRCFCDPCVHTIRRVGGRILKLCPVCSGPCEIIPWEGDQKPKKKSLLGRVWPFSKTLKLSRKRHPRS